MLTCLELGVIGSTLTLIEELQNRQKCEGQALAQYEYEFPDIFYVDINVDDGDNGHDNDACNNDWVGYSVNQRDEIINKCILVKWLNLVFSIGFI